MEVVTDIHYNWYKLWNYLVDASLLLLTSFQAATWTRSHICFCWYCCWRDPQQRDCYARQTVTKQQNKQHQMWPGSKVAARKFVSSRNEASKRQIHNSLKLCFSFNHVTDGVCLIVNAILQRYLSHTFHMSYRLRRRPCGNYIWFNVKISRGELLFHQCYMNPDDGSIGMGE